ncbi:MAG: DUF3501 family protein [Candidatus Competibacteraceae bacterium]|jgi:hypothetical protein|nr:DUF3501 family protein [Candidatus Competibacteraceae bacterium]
MQKLSRTDLFSLEAYAEKRKDFRAQVLEHKQHRKVALGDHVTLLFEDRLTIHYQIQEMLRVERIFEASGIEEELAAYNPLIPDGSNLKATLLIEYTDVDERKRALAELKGLETRIWLHVSGFDPVRPIADEDLERENEEKTSSVHFLRFEFTPEMIAAVKQGASLGAGVDHSYYQATVNALPETVRQALVADFD